MVSQECDLWPDIDDPLSVRLRHLASANKKNHIQQIGGVLNLGFSAIKPVGANYVCRKGFPKLPKLPLDVIIGYVQT
jgi:hypothetical protein